MISRYELQTSEKLGRCVLKSYLWCYCVRAIAKVLGMCSNFVYQNHVLIVRPFITKIIKKLRNNLRIRFHFNLDACSKTQSFPCASNMIHNCILIINLAFLKVVFRSFLFLAQNGVVRFSTFDSKTHPIVKLA